MKKAKAKSRILFAIIFFLFVIVLFLLRFGFPLFYYADTDVRNNDLNEASSGRYDCLILSMLPSDGLSAEDFNYYRGINSYKANHQFKNLRDLNDFLVPCENKVSNVYLVADCISIGTGFGFHASLYSKEYTTQLLSVIRNTPDTSYEILLPYNSRDYWCSLNDSDTEDVIDTLRDFVNIFYYEPNVTIYYLGYEEWLIANSGNYTSYNTCNEDVMRTITLATFSDEKYILTVDNMSERFDKIRSIRKGISTYDLLNTDIGTIFTDLSDTDVVFFGDSVIANYTDSTSIPGVLEGFSGAHVYNIGLGGTGAASSSNKWDLNKIIEAFISKDISGFEEDEQPLHGIKGYLDDHVDPSERKTCFIINYGLNDYFGGSPVGDSDVVQSFSTDTYSAALSHAIYTLREAYPMCRIILMTPTYCSYFNDGTQLQSDVGGTLGEYAEAVVQVAAKNNVEYIDNYNIGINSTNQKAYLIDGCHPNEVGRYIIGTRIVNYLK